MKIKNSALFISLSNSPVVSYKILKTMLSLVDNLFIVVNKRTKNNLQKLESFLIELNTKIIEIKENDEKEDFLNIKEEYGDFLKSNDIKTVYFDVNSGFGFYRFIFYETVFSNQKTEKYLINLSEKGYLRISDREFNKIDELYMDITSENEDELETLMKLYNVETLDSNIIYRNGKSKIDCKDFEVVLEKFKNDETYRLKFITYWKYYQDKLKALKEDKEKAVKYIESKLLSLSEFTALSKERQKELVNDLFQMINTEKISINSSKTINKYFNDLTPKEKEILKDKLDVVFVISPVKESDIPVDILFEKIIQCELVSIVNKNLVLKEKILAIYSDVRPNKGREIQIDILILLKNGKFVNIELKTYHSTAKRKDLTSRISNFKKVVGDKNYFFLVFPLFRKDIEDMRDNKWKDTFKMIEELDKIELTGFDELEKKLLDIVKR